MNKTHIFNILSLVLTFAFAFGSMAGMNLILQARERQLLTERGSAVVEPPVRAWEGLGNGEDSEVAENSDSERFMLTDEQIEDAVRCWNAREEETMHNPVAGQISMEEAIQTGEEWLMEMGMTGGGQETAAYSIKATLGVGNQKGDSGAQLEPYYSFWTVRFSSQAMSTVLYLNAVTGRVWGAEITLYENSSEALSFGNLGLFVELAGLQASKDNYVIINTEETQATLAIEGNLLYAKAEYYHIVSKHNDYYDIDEYGIDNFYNVINGQTVINYKLLSK